MSEKFWCNGCNKYVLEFYDIEDEYVCLNCYDPELHGLSIYPMASCLNMEATTNE